MDCLLARGPGAPCSDRPKAARGAARRDESLSLGRERTGDRLVGDGVPGVAGRRAKAPRLSRRRSGVPTLPLAPPTAGGADESGEERSVRRRNAAPRRAGTARPTAAIARRASLGRKAADSGLDSAV